MIKLTKGPEPDVIKEAAALWTEQLLEQIANGENYTSAIKKYRHQDIKLAIIAETHGKCAYCESKLLHSQFGDIEHYVPKSLDPLRAFDWTNLTLACRICNTLKASRDPFVEDILDPYYDTPVDHLEFAGALLFASCSQKGVETKVKLSLNRPDLCERRKESLERLLGLTEMMRNPALTVSARRAIYEDFVANELVDAAQFAGMARSLFHQVKAKIEAQWEREEAA